MHQLKIMSVNEYSVSSNGIKVCKCDVTHGEAQARPNAQCGRVGLELFFVSFFSFKRKERKGIN
ncbi:MAG TPA: hypothetical protein VG738_09195 [Chitinophagaceae bacterium]|nr:hypothetical protein [Chitinophagaceae bacterium]